MNSHWWLSIIIKLDHGPTPGKLKKECKNKNIYNLFTKCDNVCVGFYSSNRHESSFPLEKGSDTTQR